MALTNKRTDEDTISLQVERVRILQEQMRNYCHQRTNRDMMLVAAPLFAYFGYKCGIEPGTGIDSFFTGACALLTAGSGIHAIAFQRQATEAFRNCLRSARLVVRK